MIFQGTLTTTLKEATPTIFVGVPRVWEKIQEKMLEVGAANKGLKRTIGQWAKKTGLGYNQNIMNGSALSLSSELKYKIADKVVFQVIKCF
jgi:long-chain-fatty-acid--CoA ligase ACSBG